MNCKKCGALADFDQYGPFLFIEDSNAIGLTGLFARQLDEARCEVCDHGLGFQITLAVVLSDPPEILLAPGDRLKQNAATGVSLLRAQFEQLGYSTITELDSAEALRAEVWQRMTRYYALFEEAERAGKANQLAEWMTRRWRELTPAAFVAGRLILGAKAADRGLPPESPQVVNSFRRLAEDQANSWVMMCREWAESPPTDRSFEDDLARYLVATAIHPWAVEEFAKRADLFANDHPDADRHRYCLEAARATLHSFFDQPNPRVEEWAGRLVSYELLIGQPGAEDPEGLGRLRISQERARQTVTYQALYDALLPVFEKRNRKFLGSLQALTDRLGFPDMLLDLGKALRIAPDSDPQLPDHPKLLDQLLAANPPASPEEAIEATIGALRAARHFFSNQFSADDLEALADAALQRLPDTDVARAEVNAWVGSALKDLREPERFLRRVGETIQPSEENLPRQTQISLWTERGTALRLARNPQAARAVYERVAKLFEGRPDSRDARIARRNLAIALRETGAPDLALGMLQEQLPLAAGEERLSLLDNLGATHLALGQVAEARKCYEAALELAAGPFERERARFAAALEATLAFEDSAENTIRRLLQRPAPKAEDEAAVFAEASAWLMALHNAEDIELVNSDEAKDRTEELMDALFDLSDRAQRAGDVQLRLMAVAALCQLADLYELPQATEMWDDLNQLSLDAGRGLDPRALLALARIAYRDGAVSSGRAFLEMIPGALMTRVGGVQQLDLAVESLRDLGWMFSRATRAVIEQPQASLADARLAAEVSRDAIRRTMQIGYQRSDDAVAFVSPTDEQLAALTPPDGAVGVIEWIDIGIATAMLLTTINQDRRVASTWLQLPEIDLDKLRGRILSKLNNWTLLRPGDPFELKEWREFERWVATEIAQHLPDESHLAIIEHEDLSGFPWHVAAAPRWTCSYASGWNALLNLPMSGDRTDQTVGVALAPAFDESAEMAAALRDSAERTAAFAASRGLPFVAAYEKECDRERLRELLETREIVKLLCHGYVSAEEREVALMIAANGQLPLKLPQAADSPAGRVHRFSWRQIAELKRAPRLIFSAACSSARAHIAGQGERLGLFPPLRERGANAMVAPGWKIEAPVFGILDDAIETYLAGDISLARALRAACRKAEAQDRVPRWLAWSLTIEGDWR